MGFRDDKLRRLLSAAGWYEGRSYRPKRFASRLNRYGFQVHEAALAFFREFGGLCLRYPVASHPDGQIVYEIDLRTPAGPQRPMMPFMEQLDTEVGPLTPITLELIGPVPFYRLMAPDGRVYAFNDCFIDVPEQDGVIWGPWQSGWESLVATVNFEEYPVFRRAK